MGAMEMLDARLGEELEALAKYKEMNEIGGRQRLDMETLLRTELLIADVGHHAAAEMEGITYHAVRYRMRRLDTMRKGRK